MRRREFIATVGSAAVWPLMAKAQSSGKLPITFSGQILRPLRHGPLPL